MGYEKTFDVDGHVMEPPELWEQYLEAKYKSRGIFIRYKDNGTDYIEIDGRPAVWGQPKPGLGRGLGSMGGIGGYPDMDRAKQQARQVFTYVESAPPGAMNPHERIKVLDQEGIDVALLYPTIGLIWEGHVTDPDLAAALCRAYNNWLIDFCKPYRQRLVPVAHISLLDVHKAVVEMNRTAKLGARAFYIRPDLVNGRTLGHRDYDPLWATAQDLGLPITPHVIGHNLPLDDWCESLADQETGFILPIFRFSLSIMLPITASFTAMMSAGTFHRFPGLRYGVLETGAGWIVHWLDRMNSKWKVDFTHSPCKEMPEFYFRRQCYVSIDPDERTVASVIGLVGDDSFVWASDFPHMDAEFGALRELKEHMTGLPEISRRKILGENAARIYQLPA